jgi:hypothetical protein
LARGVSAMMAYQFHLIWEFIVFHQYFRKEVCVSSGGSKPATCGHFKTGQSEAGDS